jgi:hypothetical protein
MAAMASIQPDLKKKLEREPGSTVNLIVRLKDAPDIHVADVRALGLTVRYTYSLVSAMAVQGTASASLVLAKKPWVLSVEEDKQVHTML